jgi:hypothetical protein
MNAKQFLWIGTMSFVITISMAMKGEDASASTLTAPYNKIKEASLASQDLAIKDTFHQALGVSSEEEVFDALYNGQSLSDIAKANNADVQNVIDLQVAQLTSQLDQRYAAGSLPPESYEAQKSELADIITKSAYASYGY